MPMSEWLKHTTEVDTVVLEDASESCHGSSSLVINMVINKGQLQYNSVLHEHAKYQIV